MSGAWMVALLVPAAVAAGAIALLLRTRWAVLLADHPNHRSLHDVPVPRLGGLGIMAGSLPVAAWAGWYPFAGVLAAALGLALLSLADDVRSLPIQVRLPAHFTAAAIAVLTLAAPHANDVGLGWIEAVGVLMAIVWMTNLFNFMDGSDGLAGGVAAIGFAAYAIAAAAAGALPLALCAGALASASAGFLAYNFPPARVFMGDAGSIPVGFLAGAFGLHGYASGAWPAWFPVLVFSPFIADATVTLVRRLGRRERVWAAHRTHAYQRLVLAGWSRRRLAVGAYGLMAGTGASAVAGRAAGWMLQCGIIFVWLAAFFLMLAWIERRARISRS